MSGQIDILRRELLAICYDQDSQHDSIVASIRLLITRHQRIIMFSDNIEELYSNIALMQFLSNTVVICCIGFTFISVSRLINRSRFIIFNFTLNFFVCFSDLFLPILSPKSLAKDRATVVLLKSAIFYFAITLEAFIFCFVGEYLSAKVRAQYFILHMQCYILFFHDRTWPIQYVLQFFFNFSGASQIS